MNALRTVYGRFLTARDAKERMDATDLYAKLLDEFGIDPSWPPGPTAQYVRSVGQYLRALRSRELRKEKSDEARFMASLRAAQALAPVMQAIQEGGQNAETPSSEITNMNIYGLNIESLGPRPMTIQWASRLGLPLSASRRKAEERKMALPEEESDVGYSWNTVPIYSKALQDDLPTDHRMDVLSAMMIGHGHMSLPEDEEPPSAYSPR